MNQSTNNQFEKLILIKLGGSLITDKTKPKTFKPQLTFQLAQQIKKFKDQHPDQTIIIGHGAGSFAHVSAHQYQTHKGFINQQSKYGFCVVRHDVQHLNFLVMEQILKANVIGHVSAAISYCHHE